MIKQFRDSRIIVAAAVLLTISAVTILVMAKNSMSLSSANNASATQEALAYRRQLDPLAKKLNIKITVINEPLSIPNGLFTSIEAKVPPNRFVSLYLPKFTSELSLYPPRAIAAIGLKEILICGQALYRGERRGAISDHRHHILLFDARLEGLDYHARKSIHHEMFHLLDWKDDGQVYRDDEWKKLNSPDFEYGHGGVSVQHVRGVSRLDPTLHGFLNRYSMSGVEEDKAEMFALMMVNYKMVDLRSESDPVIKAKMFRIKTLLYKFCPAFDDEFWAKVKEHSI